MAEPTEPENPHKSDPARPDPAQQSHPEPAEPQADGDEEEMGEDEGPPIDPDIRTGFSMEQRRFMWTLTGLNVVAVLLGAAIIVGYLATARSQDAAAERLDDVYKTAVNKWNRAAQANMYGMIHATLIGDKDEYVALHQEVFDDYQAQLEARVAARRAKGLPADDPTQEELAAYMKSYDDQFAQNLRLNLPTTRSSTQPATQSATEPATQSATMPASGTK